MHKKDYILYAWPAVGKGEGPQVACMSSAGRLVVPRLARKEKPTAVDDLEEHMNSAAKDSMEPPRSFARADHPVFHQDVLHTPGLPVRRSPVVHRICQRDSEPAKHQESGSRSLRKIVELAVLDCTHSFLCEDLLHHRRHLQQDGCSHGYGLRSW